MFSKIIKAPEPRADRKVIVEICCIVGMSALSKDQLDISVRWLERALESSSFCGQQSEQPDLALKDMRLLALHAFGNVPLASLHKCFGGKLITASSSAPST